MAHRPRGARSVGSCVDYLARFVPPFLRQDKQGKRKKPRKRKDSWVQLFVSELRPACAGGLRPPERAQKERGVGSVFTARLPFVRPLLRQGLKDSDGWLVTSG